jgi:hypothetical protein
MANIVSYYEINFAYSGKVTFNGTYGGQPHGDSPGDIDLIQLQPGSNQINTPVLVANNPIAAMIIVPSTGMLGAMMMKGLAGDTGLPLSVINPSLLAVTSNFSTFYIELTGTAVPQKIHIAWL